MLIYLLSYKKSEYVIKAFNDLITLLGNDEFKRLFEVILTDNGTEFSDPNSIECDLNTGEKVCSLFYCDPNCSWQKGSLEKNHEYIRYILPKGSSFASLTQEDCYLIASHINSVPRLSLNNQSPFEASFKFIGEENIKKININKIDIHTTKILFSYITSGTLLMFIFKRTNFPYLWCIIIYQITSFIIHIFSK